MKIYTSVDQGSADWFRLRMGIPTASCFDQILTPKTRKLSASHIKYACRLIAERLMSQPTESVKGQEWMDRGRELEPDAVRQFETVYDIETARVSFVTTDNGTVGASPDRLQFTASGKALLQAERDFLATGSDIVGCFEVKCPSLPVHLGYLLMSESASYGSAAEAAILIYRCQVQGQMLVCETDQAVLYSYFPRGPAVAIRTGRDDGFCRDLAGAINTFNDKLADWLHVAERFGTWQAFERVLTPTEIEEQENLAGTVPMSDAEVERLMGGDQRLDWAG